MKDDCSRFAKELNNWKALSSHLPVHSLSSKLGACDTLLDKDPFSG